MNKYFGKKHVVKNVDLQVKKGEIYGFFVLNGSGKTTTLRMICGLLYANSGEGSCLGYPLNSPQIKENVGYMTQKFSFYEDLTIYENLMFVARIYGLKNRKDIVMQALDELGLKGRQNQLTGELSGGWKQRLALCACLLHQPKLLLLDEPTAGVDPKARREFWSQIHELSLKGITTLVSTHYMDEAEQCTRLAYIAYGDLLIHGTIKEVIDYVGLQTYIIEGEHLNRLIHQIEALGSVSLVAQFGDKLHVCGLDKIQLEEELQEFLSDKPYQFKASLPYLEDAFIQLVNQSQDNFV